MVECVCVDYGSDTNINYHSLGSVLLEGGLLSLTSCSSITGGNMVQNNILHIEGFWLNVTTCSGMSSRIRPQPP